MSKPIPHPPASLTPAQGIEIIEETIRVINSDEDMDRLFIFSVHKGLVGMRARLKDGAYFTEGMERTLMNWSRVIGAGSKKPSDPMM